MIILDTNVVSEMVLPHPADVLLSQVKRFPSSQIYTTAITEAELRLGLALLPQGTRRRRLQTQIEGILQETLAGRIIAFDSRAAEAYAEVVSTRRAAGRPISAFDGQIAAIARVRGAVLLTRNTRDFDGCAIDVINPWIAR